MMSFTNISMLFLYSSRRKLRPMNRYWFKEYLLFLLTNISTFTIVSRFLIESQEGFLRCRFQRYTFDCYTFCFSYK
jgi:hypothetical protein